MTDWDEAWAALHATDAETQPMDEAAETLLRRSAEYEQWLDARAAEQDATGDGTGDSDDPFGPTPGGCAPAMTREEAERLQHLFAGMARDGRSLCQDDYELWQEVRQVLGIAALPEAAEHAADAADDPFAPEDPAEVRRLDLLPARPGRPCAACHRGMPPAEARLSIRTLGRPLCWRCRPSGEPDEILESRTTGYGLHLLTIRTPCGTYQGAGHSESQALTSARHRAREARR